MKEDIKNKMDQIDWKAENYWKKLHIFDENFLSFHFDHAIFGEDAWKDLVDKWKLKTKISEDRESLSVYNDNYSIVLTGDNYDEIPCSYLVLTFSENISMRELTRFYKDFKSSLDDYDDALVLTGLVGEFTSHPKEIIIKMIEVL